MTLALSLINVVLALFGAIGVLRLGGKWTEVETKEEQDLRSQNFGKSSCCLRVRLSFSKACKKVDEVCGMLGTGAMAIVAVTVVFAVGVLIVEQLVTPSATAAPAAAALPATTNVQAVAPQPAASVAQPNASPTQTAKTEAFLLPINLFVLLFLVVILSGVGHLRVLASVLAAGREFRW